MLKTSPKMIHSTFSTPEKSRRTMTSKIIQITDELLQTVLKL